MSNINKNEKYYILMIHKDDKIYYDVKEARLTSGGQWVDWKETDGKKELEYFSETSLYNTFWEAIREAESRGFIYAGRLNDNSPDYKDDLVFEPDYSVYETARKLRNLSKKRKVKIYRDCIYWLNFCGISINLDDFEVLAENTELDIKIKSRRHLLEIVEVLTRR